MTGTPYQYQSSSYQSDGLNTTGNIGFDPDSDTAGERTPECSGDGSGGSEMQRPTNTKTAGSSGTTDTASVRLMKEAMQQNLNSSLFDCETKLSENAKALFEKQRRDAYGYLTDLRDKLSIFGQVLRLKLQSYASWYDAAQIGIIVLSSVITLSTAVESEVINLVDNQTASFIDGITKRQLIDSAFSFFTLFSSAAIGMTSAVTKFKAWKSKSNAMSTVYASSLYTQEVLELTRERVKLARTVDELNEILGDGFVNRQYTLFQKTMSQIRQLLPLEAQVSHIPKFYNLNLESAKQRKSYETSLTQIEEVKVQTD